MLLASVERWEGRSVAVERVPAYGAGDRRQKPTEAWEW
jgi:hypothetical protein